MSNKIDEVTRLQLEQFAKATSKAIGCQGVALIISSDNKSAMVIECDHDVDSMYEIARSLVNCADMGLKRMTGGKCELFVKFGNKESVPVAEYFNRTEENQP